jgi:NTE family protein
VDPSGLRGLIARHLSRPQLEDTLIPMHVAATDLLTGASVLLSSGPTADAILASCAIPGAFPPVRIGDHYLIDGAIAGNTPVMAALALGATRLVVLPTRICLRPEHGAHGRARLRLSCTEPAGRPPAGT